MIKSDKHICPRCGNDFNCRPGNISNCGCHAVIVPDELRQWLREKYEDCLCANCLVELKEAPRLFMEKFRGG